jgi:LPS O-antigen subunit length determinant protein (WzzB/FepE family)
MTNYSNQSDPVKFQTDSPEDEIELIDLLRVIWKWKYLIISSAIFCAIAAIVVSLKLPKIFRIEAIIRPGIQSFSEDGENIYIDTPDNIKALIETGAFGKKVLDNLDDSNISDIPKEVRFKVTFPKSSSTLKISYDTPHVSQGIMILKLLGKFLSEEYDNLVKYFQNEIDRDINIKKAGIKKNNSVKRSHETNIENLTKRIRELEAEAVFINKNTTSLNVERNNLLSKVKDESNILSIILYSNTIQQNLQLANDYKNEIKNLKLTRENELQQISKLENELQTQIAEIENLKIKKRNVQNIQIIQEPYSSIDPVKPKKMSIIIISVFGGMIAMIFLVFLLEYISKNKKRKFI